MPLITYLAQQEHRHRRKGSALMLFILSLLAMTPLLFYTFNMLHSYSERRILKSFHHLVSTQAARSSFALMEGALARRLWEVPPDANCLKLTEFSLSGTTDEGATYTTTASYDVTTRIMTLAATASYKGETSTFGKAIKILDVSDFLTFSKGSGTTTFVREGDPRQAVGILAKDRKVYFEGPVEFRNNVKAAPESITDWSTPRATNPLNEYGMLFQGDRLYFLGGIQYSPVSFVQTPVQSWPGHSDPELAQLKTLLESLGSRTAQRSRGAALFFKDFATADLLFKNVVSGPPAAAGLPSQATLQKQVYPSALFCQGVPPAGFPLNPQTATDSGCFLNDTDLWKVWNYKWGAGIGTGNNGEFSCMADGTVPLSSRKSCSSSTTFPKGFAAWKAQAGLDGILIGSEGEQINYTAINWDHFEALKEDAQACGVVVESATSGTYEDCNLVDQRVISSYLTGTNPCENVRKFDMETLGSKLANFDGAAYANPINKGRFLRRVIYGASPTEIAQTNASGLWTGLSGATERANLGLWLVNEERWILKPHQPDTSPVDFTATSKAHRKTYFNQDILYETTPSTALRSLNLILLSPDQVQINSPQHVPYTFAQMQELFPIASGKIKPLRDIVADWTHQENDAYQSGMRDVYMNNIGLITNALSGDDTGFFLRGLWVANDASLDKLYINMCRMDFPGDFSAALPITSTFTNFELDKTNPRAVPHAFPDNPFYMKHVPPSDSAFYRHTTDGKIYDYGHIPFAFSQANDDYDVHIYFKGAKIAVPFDATVPSGKKSLVANRLAPEDQVVGDFSDRRYAWEYGTTYQDRPGPSGAACVNGSTVRIDNGNPITGVDLFYVNRQGTPHFLQLPPEDDFRDIGSVFSVELPILKYR